MPPKEKSISAPKGGWKEQAYYIVEASFASTNPIHRYIFFTGFLNGGKWKPGVEKPQLGIPGGYNQFLNIEDGATIKDAYYLLPVHLLAIDELSGGVSTIDGRYSLVRGYIGPIEIKDDE